MYAVCKADLIPLDDGMLENLREDDDLNAAVCLHKQRTSLTCNSSITKL